MNTTQIKAIGIEQVGASDKLKNLTLQQPQLGERDLLVKVLSVSVNPVDYIKRNLGIAHMGELGPQNPIVLGYDAVGVVVNQGNKASFYNINDKVFYAGNILNYGTNSNYHVIDERIVGKLPQTINEKQAAGFPLVTLTAWEGIECQLGVAKNSQNKSILVINGAGGVGTMIVQLAKVVFGLKVIATASRPETISHCKSMGADFVINHYKNLGEQFKEQKIDQVDYVFCTASVTDSIIAQTSEIIKPFGSLCVIAGTEKVLNIDPYKAKSGKVVQEFMFTRSMFQTNMEKQKEILDNLSALIDQKKIKSIVNKELPFNLENLKAAHDMSASGKSIGKIVLYDVDKYFEQQKKFY